MKRRVYFVGAGFSKALCSAYPVLTELSKSVTQNFCARYASGAIREHYNQLPATVVDDIEQLLSYLFSDWPWKSSVERDLDSALYKALTFEISKCLSAIATESLSEHYQHLVNFLARKNNQVVSLNYDGLLESLYLEYALPKGEDFSGLRLYVEDIFDEEKVTTPDKPWHLEDLVGEGYIKKKLTIRRDYISNIEPVLFNNLIATTKVAQWSSYSPDMLLGKYKPNKSNNGIHKSAVVGIEILKLHGSIDTKDPTHNTNIRVVNDDGSVSWESIPAIVPPVLDKSRYYAGLKDLWSKAHLALEQADEIVVIGFSFPPTDISCQFLFKSALKNCNGVRVVPVNRDIEVKARYDFVFKGIPGVEVDYSYVIPDDPLLQYIKGEIIKPED